MQNFGEQISCLLGDVQIANYPWGYKMECPIANLEHSQLNKNKPVIQPFLHAPRCKNRIFRHTERFEKPQTGAKYYYTGRKL